VPPKDAKEASAVEKYRDQLFWQTTAAQLLGEIQDQTAIEPLLKVMFDPAKADVQATAILALVKIGPPAVQRTVKILKDQDEAMAAYAASKYQKAFDMKEAPKNKPHIATAAVILGTIGRSEALAPMMEALDSTKDETNKAVIAREIPKIPATPASKQAFRTAYEGISLDTDIPPGQNALQVLTESAGTFYDPDFVPWLIGRAGATKGSSDQQSLLQSTATVTAIKLMKPEQVNMVNGAVRRWGTQIEKDSFKMASELLKACGDRVSCYLTALEKSQNQEKETQFTAIKAAYMVGIYGDEKARDGLVERLDSLENAAVRFTAAQTIDYLSPKGSKEAADLIQKIIDKNAKSADRNKAAADAPLKQVMYRIRARAE
jgi:HEAT repeat protein